MSVSSVHDLAPLCGLPFLHGDLRLDAASARRRSPVHFPPPPTPQTLMAVVGAQEREEFRSQTLRIRAAWGARAVPVCEELPGCNHFSVLHDLADPQGRAHQLAWGFFGALGGGSLPTKLAEQIAVAVADRNGCEYCLAAHTMLGRKAGASAAEMSAAQAGESADPATPTLRPCARRASATARSSRSWPRLR